MKEASSNRKIVFVLLAIDVIIGVVLGTQRGASDVMCIAWILLVIFVPLTAILALSAFGPRKPKA